MDQISPDDLATVEGELKLAESELTRAHDRLDPGDRGLDKKPFSSAQKISNELAFKKAQFALEQAKSKRRILVNFTKKKNILELESELEKARADELAKKATWNLEKLIETKLER